MTRRFLGNVCALSVASCVVSVTSAQTQLWVDQFGTLKTDYAYAAAADGNGGLFFGGTTSGNMAAPAQDFDVWLARTDSHGTHQWVRQFGSATTDAMFGAASDGVGGVIAVGYTAGSMAAQSAGFQDAWITRFDAAGQQAWVVQFGSAGTDVARAVVSDGAGGALLCGQTSAALGGPHAGDNDAWVARCDGAGNLLWLRQLGTPESDVAWGAASDGAGGIIVCGETWGSLAGPNAGFTDGWLARFDAAGTLVWSRQIGMGSFEVANAAASDGAGGVFVVGSTTGSLGGAAQGAYDGWAARYDAAGSQQWLTQFGGASNDWITSAQADGSGGLFLCGQVATPIFGSGGTDSDALLARLDGSGALLWTQSLGASDADDASFATAPAGVGGVFVAGSTYGNFAADPKGSTDVWVARYDGDCNAGTAYCSASSTSLPGCQAAIAGAGAPTLANPGAFTISSGSVPGGNLGLLLFGSSGSASVPFGTLGGLLCVAAPTFRSAPKPGGGAQGQCNGNFGFALQDLINAAPIVTSGAALHAQVWARDPANADGFLLSDGLAFTVCP